MQNYSDNSVPSIVYSQPSYYKWDIFTFKPLGIFTIAKEKM